MSTQYETLKKNYITNSQSAYNQLAGNLGRISKENIDNITTGSTDQKVRDIANKFNEYYTKYDNAYSLIDSAVGILRLLKADPKSIRKNIGHGKTQQINAIPPWEKKTEKK